MLPIVFTCTEHASTVVAVKFTKSGRLLVAAADRLLVMAPAGVAEERWPPVLP